MAVRKLIIDTSACSRIANSPQRRQIEAHVDRFFRRAVSVHTFWELLDQIKGGDGSHFPQDKEVIKVAAGTRRSQVFLPDPLSYAIAVVLKRQPPPPPVPPSEVSRMYNIIIRAKTRDQLYTGVPVKRGSNRLVYFDPQIVEDQQQFVERIHVYRLKWAQTVKLAGLTAKEWARTVVQNATGETMSDEQASELAKRLDATYQFDKHIWNLATAVKGYNPEKPQHRNDFVDMQQVMYLCDPAVDLITADKGLCQKVALSTQANRIHYLPDYLTTNGLSL